MSYCLTLSSVKPAERGKCAAQSRYLLFTDLISTVTVRVPVSAEARPNAVILFNIETFPFIQYNILIIMLNTGFVNRILIFAFYSQKK